MKILIAPDKFKGSLSARKVCEAIQSGLQQQNEKFEIISHPMADGGDGSLEVLTEYLDLKNHQVQTVDPLGRIMTAEYFTSSDAAFIEVASASGLVLLKEEERNPLKTSTLGTGRMIADALTKGYQQIYLFLGGSATNDAGLGIAAALGGQFLDKNGKILEPIGENLAFIKQITCYSKFDFEKIKMTLLCDVRNPLFGKNGAAYIYAPQKGATEEQVRYLDGGLQNFSQVLFQQTDIDISNLAGAGAAGGIGAGLTALFGAKLQKGFTTIAKLTHFEQRIQRADWVISGEGKLDAQSLQGKVIDGIAELCKKYQKPLALFVGKNDLNLHEMDTLKVKHIFSISEKANNLVDAMTNGAQYLEEMAKRCSIPLTVQNQQKMDSIFKQVEQALSNAGFEFERKDFNRPWGGFFVIEASQTAKFAERYFPDFALADLTKGLKVSPKILLVAPHKRLSWQYHFRRSEIWKVVRGTVGIIKNDTDEQTPLLEYSVGDTVILQKGERHRLVGLGDWGMVAEIWQHTDPEHLSDENDIVRLQDDFNRKTP